MGLRVPSGSLMKEIVQAVRGMQPKLAQQQHGAATEHSVREAACTAAKKKKSPKKKSHKVVFVSSCLGVRRINKTPRKTEVATGEEEESRRRCGSTRTRTTYSRDESRAQSYWKINFRIERVTDFKYNNEFPFESGIIRARTGRLIRQTQSTLIHQ